MMTFTEEMGDRPSSPNPLAAATALLAAAIVGVGLLLMQRDSGGVGKTDAGRPAAASVSTAQSERSSDHVAIQSRPQPAATASDGLFEAERSRKIVTVYIAGSPEEAERARAGLHEADVTRLHLGLPPLNAVVVVVDSAEAALVLRLIADADAIRETLRLSLPPIAVVDLRAR